MGIIDGDGKRIWKKKLRNDPSLIVATLTPFKEDTVGIVVESTYNWYWLVDLADIMAGHIYSHFIIPYWNAFVRLCFFLIVTELGSVTFNSPPATVDDMVRKADTLMYRAKNSGTNKIIMELDN